MAVIVVPLAIVAFAAVRRSTRGTEALAERDPATALRTEQEFADAERYEEEWREARRQHERDE